MSAHADCARAGGRRAADPPLHGPRSRSPALGAHHGALALRRRPRRGEQPQRRLPVGHLDRLRRRHRARRSAAAATRSALLVYILNKGEYHPLVRPAILTSLLGYGLAVLAVIIDLGRFWDLWKVPIFVWRWTPLAAARGGALRRGLRRRAARSSSRRPSSRSCGRARRVGLRSLRRERACAFVEKSFVWILALGLLLPTMHQSSLGTHDAAAGPEAAPALVHARGCRCCSWSTASSWARGRGARGDVLRGSRSAARARPRCSAALSQVAMWVALGWVAFRVLDVALRGKLGYLASWLRRSPFLVRGRACWSRAPSMLVSEAPPAPAGLAGARRRSCCSLGGAVSPLQHLPGRLPPGRALVATSRRCPSC